MRRCVSAGPDRRLQIATIMPQIPRCCKTIISMQPFGTTAAAGICVIYKAHHTSQRTNPRDGGCNFGEMQLNPCLLAAGGPSRTL
jgi:hypothetical protein